MAYWRYGVVRYPDPQQPGARIHALAECHFDDAGQLTGWSEPFLLSEADTPAQAEAELRDILDRLRTGLERPGIDTPYTPALPRPPRPPADQPDADFRYCPHCGRDAQEPPNVGQLWAEWPWEMVCTCCGQTWSQCPCTPRWDGPCGVQHAAPTTPADAL